MGERWGYGEDGFQAISFEMRPDGAIDIVAAGYDGYTEITAMPYEEFKALAAVMHEEHLAWRALQETKPTAKLVREVMALSGLGPGEVAELVGGVGSNSMRTWLSGGLVSSAKEERLIRLRSAFQTMPYDPHLGCRQAVFSAPEGGLSLHEQLRRELPRSEPIQGTGY